MKQFNLQFGGFYNSTHEQLIDSMLENYFMNDEGEYELPDNINYKAIFDAYCLELLPIYKEYISDEHGLDVNIKFLQLDSPHFYNYSTDTMLCEISNESFNAIKKHFLSDKNFVEYANRESKSRSGFSSLYDGILEITANDSILLEYIFMYITDNIMESEFYYIYDRNNVYELLYNLDFIEEEAD